MFVPLVGVKAVKTQTQDIIEQTMDFWSQRTGQQFSQEDARQAVDNVCGFFAMLAEWQRRASEEDGSNQYGRNQDYENPCPCTNPFVR